MKRLILLSLTSAAIGLMAVSVPTPLQAQVDNTSAIVQFSGEPLSTYVKTKPPQGKKIDFNSTSVKAYRAQLNGVRNNFKAWLRNNAPSAAVTGEFDLA